MNLFSRTTRTGYCSHSGQWPGLKQPGCADVMKRSSISSPGGRIKSPTSSFHGSQIFARIGPSPVLNPFSLANQKVNHFGVLTFTQVRLSPVNIFDIQVETFEALQCGQVASPDVRGSNPSIQPPPKPCTAARRRFQVPRCRPMDTAPLPGPHNRPTNIPRIPSLVVENLPWTSIPLTPNLPPPWMPRPGASRTIWN